MGLLPDVDSITRKFEGKMDALNTKLDTLIAIERERLDLERAKGPST